MRALTAGVLLALTAATAAAQAPYSNPVLRHPAGVADPFLLKWNGEYYLYATGDPLIAFHSKDLVHWDSIGPVLSSSRDVDAWNQADVWAPEVVYRNGKFYLYYTASRAAEDWRIGEMARRLGVGVSDSPRGPFVDIGRAVSPGWGIDGHVFKDPADGREWMFYSYLFEPRLPGAGIVVDFMRAAETMAGKPALVTRGSEAWEDKDGDPGNGSLRYTNEAPTVLKRHGRYYMMYSGGSWDLPTYAMAYAVSDELKDTGLDATNWVKVMPPLLRSTTFAQGPGHNSVAKAPNNVDEITAYHARAVPFAGPGDRQTFIDRLYWLRDRLYMEQPTLAPLAPPDRPVFGDLFDRADGPLGTRWKIVAGNWQVRAGAARQNGGSDYALALPVTAPLAHYVFEANIRLPARGAAGVAAFYRDAGNRVDVWLDAARRSLITTGVLNGRAVPQRTNGLAPDFRFDAYHQILITRNGGDLRIQLDGVDMQRLQIPADPATAGLITRSASADFDGVAFSAFYEDTFDEPEATWQAASTWLVDEGALHQVAGGAVRHVVLKGDAAVDYEFTASVRVRDNESTASMVGIVAAASETGRLVLAGFDRTIWPYARFRVQLVENGTVRNTIAVEMPRGFDYNAYHTIRVVKQGSAFTFHLDGPEIVAATFDVGSARPGLFTEAARAAFDDVAMKHLVVARNLVLDASFDAERWDERAAGIANPWQLSGGAQASMCCAYTGVRRLLLDRPAASARQELRGLAAGSYRAQAWVTTQDGSGELIVRAGERELGRAGAQGGAWTLVTVDFELPAEQTVTLSLSPRLAAGKAGFVAADDVYLYRR